MFTTIAAAVLTASVVLTPISVNGDSNTAGYPAKTLTSGISQELAPAAQISGSLTVSVKKSYAVPGKTTKDLRAHAQNLDGMIASLAIGTNDIRLGIPVKTSMKNIEAWEKASNPDALLVMAIPPYTHNEKKVVAYNKALKKLADKKGWRYGDPWKDFRTADGGGWSKKGAHVDDKHGSAKANKVVGTKLNSTLKKMAAAQ